MLGVGLEQIAGVLSRLENWAIRVHPRQCAKLRHRRSTCTLCADCCPTQAIAWGESLQVDPDKCVGCGICATVCPSGAIEAQSPTNPELLTLVQARAEELRAVAFACPTYLKTREADCVRSVQVNCLGRLDESILVGAVAAGVQSVRLLDGACPECPNAAGRTIAAQTAQKVNVLLQRWGIEPSIALIPRLVPEAQTPSRVAASTDGVSRRAFLERLARETTRVSVVTIQTAFDGTNLQEKKVPKKGELPTLLPVKRQILLNALQRLGKPVVKDWESNLCAQFGFRETCTGCQMCAFFCPTGALTKVEQDGKAGVAFKAAYCTNCRLCQEVCYREAVALSSAVDLSKVIADAADVLLMREAKAAPWLASPEERLKRLLESTSPKNE